MVQIDFSRIRGDLPDGQRGAFEELVCQLARRDAPSVDSFRRIEGAGGDGGVECLVKSSDGTVGYQAKFHTKSGEIDWTAIDRSVDTALKLHPDLVRYVIALPCDFTGRRRTRGDKVSDGTWGIWDAHVDKWERACAKPIQFVPWTAAELNTQLTPTNADGLRAYWFTQVEFSAQWFRERVEAAVASLDDRYNPQDHVDVHLEHLFDVMAKHLRAVAPLQAKFFDLRRVRLPRFTEANQPPPHVLTAAQDALASVLESEAELQRPAWQSWDTSRWIDAIRTAQRHVSELVDWQRQQPEPYGRTWRQLNETDNALASLEDALKHPFNSVEYTRSVLLEGTAGSGKSHLLARVAATAIAEGRPVVLWVGQQLRDQALWPQLLQRLGLPNASPDEFLGAIDTAAEAARTRALLLVDALNEGAGAKLWRAEIAEFLTQVHRYPNIAIALTCRSEYVPYLVPSGLLKELRRIPVRGFETADERAAAARVYLDRRGIARPATPWLSPEFVNPLFLRSCCNALQREGRREFPKGLTGTKAILSFYLDSVAKHLDETRSGSEDLIAPTKASLTALARGMAAARHSYIPLKEAIAIATESFEPYPAPTGLTWFDVLRRNGLLRLDPNPHVKADDPLTATSDVVRFSFQRFQDHLMAEALLADVADIEKAFSDGGSLAFVRTHKRFEWEWRGLVEALSVQIPERTGRELVDVLPRGSKQWWSVPFAQEAFLESIRWRSPSAFTDRTLALFNHIIGTHHEPLSHLIELSASIEHPWNAELIHRNLKRRPIHRRDAFWTARLNNECRDEQHSVHRLIDWCLRPEISVADFRTIRLCAITLSWLFTLSHRPVRDRATKALAHLLVAHPTVLSELTAEFQDVDDLYALERIFAAAFGAACSDPNPDRLRLYAQLAAKTLFLRTDVPANLVLRDYGRGLVQLAVERGVLPADIPAERCDPPYASPVPRLTTTEAQVERLAMRADDKAILYSSAKWGDFGRYEIEPMLRRFTAHRVTKAVKPTARARFNAFERDVVDEFRDRRVALDKLRSVIASGIRIVFFGSTDPPPTEEEERRRAEEVHDAEQRFEGLLSPEERDRYRRDARGYLGLGRARHREEPPRLDVARAQLWVAKRAYEIGRASKRLPWSHRSMEPDRGRPQLERLGKKYQWMALDELACRLADNYWIADYGDEAHRYEYPPDIGFFRDVDPTIVVQETRGPAVPWMGAPAIIIEPEEADRWLWPFEIDRGPDIHRLIRRIDDSGRTWVTAYEHQHASERKSAEQPDSFRIFGREEFRFVCLVLVRRSDRNELVQSINDARHLDIHSWDPPEFTDGPYLLEAPWRETWKAETWVNDGWRGRTVPVAFPISEYMWESHLDLALADGHRESLPSPWLMRRLGLSRRRGVHGQYEDSSGVTRMLQGPSGHDGSVTLLDHDWLAAYLTEDSLECVWLYLNERNSFLGNRHGAWRRTEGIAWIEDDQIRSHTWRDDQTRKRDED